MRGHPPPAPDAESGAVPSPARPDHQAHTDPSPPHRPRSLRRIIRRCCGAGLVFGTCTGAVYLALHQPVVSMFTKDTTVANLLHGPVWYLVAVMQPINGLVFVLDGCVARGPGCLHSLLRG